jgi:hypothetical protein
MVMVGLPEGVVPADALPQVSEGEEYVYAYKHAVTVQSALHHDFKIVLGSVSHFRTRGQAVKSTLKKAILLRVVGSSPLRFLKIGTGPFPKVFLSRRFCLS